MLYSPVAGKGNDHAVSVDDPAGWNRNRPFGKHGQGQQGNRQGRRGAASGLRLPIPRLPDYRREQAEGFTPEEIFELQELIQSLAHVIYELAGDRGFEHAAVN